MKRNKCGCKLVSDAVTLWHFLMQICGWLFQNCSPILYEKPEIKKEGGVVFYASLCFFKLLNFLKGRIILTLVQLTVKAYGSPPNQPRRINALQILVKD